MTFQIPCGEDKVFQGTGTLGLDPYICFAQNIRLGGYGSINLMNTTGYVFAVDDQRSDYFHASFHIDYDIANAHTFFPMIELNWFQYTTNGKVTPVNFEGTDLFNIGATGNSGNGYVTLRRPCATGSTIICRWDWEANGCSPGRRPSRISA